MTLILFLLTSVDVSRSLRSYCGDAVPPAFIPAQIDGIESKEWQMQGMRMRYVPVAQALCMQNFPGKNRDARCGALVCVSFWMAIVLSACVNRYVSETSPAADSLQLVYDMPAVSSLATQ
jgi:hypothetical protein